MATCSNCGAIMTGVYCQECGQKTFVESDRRFGHLLHQFLANATDLDGRVWRTLRALVFQPGLLSHEFIAGRRAHWLSPVSLFFAVSVLYFLLPSSGGDLSLQFDQQVSPRVRAMALAPGESLSDAQRNDNGQAHTPITSSWIEKRVHERDAVEREMSQGARGYTFRDYRLAYDAKANEVSKSLVIIHVPFVALALMILFARRHRYYAEHFVVALHLFSFWMFALVVVTQSRALANALFGENLIPFAVYNWFMRALLPTYALLSLRRAYDVGWVAAVPATVAFVGIVVAINIYLYHLVEFVVTFALT